MAKRTFNVGESVYVVDGIRPGSAKLYPITAVEGSLITVAGEKFRASTGRSTNTRWGSFFRTVDEQEEVDRAKGLWDELGALGITHSFGGQGDLSSDQLARIIAIVRE